ncbi:MAG: hypothetical protein LH481_17120, partial [Burkholderiales bacterium]|nr:hypothetical protein [Burkholderiales bacterium]
CLKSSPQFSSHATPMKYVDFHGRVKHGQFSHLPWSFGVARFRGNLRRHVSRFQLVRSRQETVRIPLFISKP